MITGIQIMQKLPKTNCGECGFPTCLAFAMKVAAGQIEIDKCPYLDPKIKEEIAEATSPPVKSVILGNKQYTYKLGGETVLFRHEKKFENPPLIGTFVHTAMEKQEIERKIKAYKNYKWERVDKILFPDVLMIEDKGNEEKFLYLLEKIISELPEIAIILNSENINALEKALQIDNDFRPLIYGVNYQNYRDFWELTTKKEVPLGIKANSLGELAKISESLLKLGAKELVLDSGALSVRELFEDLVIIRRVAIKKRFKPFGFPIITFMYRYTDSLALETLLASICIAKYAGIILLSDLKAEYLFPLLVERMNIYTDPQKPLVVEEGIYPINGPDENSPVIVTCNFALTYFIVSGEVEGSRVPTWVLVKDTDGLSVLTAWAAGKFGADNIAEFVKRCGIEEKVKHRELMIPGYVAGIKGELEEELPNWKIIVGPREASGLPPVLKEWSKKLKHNLD